jgi:hypothetical protein
MTRKAQKIDVKKYDRNMRTARRKDQSLRWLDPKRPPFRLAGFAWFAKDRVYRRMPVKPKHTLPEAVDVLANCTAGGQIQFQTDSRRVFLRVKLAGTGVMYHITAVGQNGFDCYLGPAGRQRYCSSARFEPDQVEYETCCYELPAGVVRNVTLNFPLYQGVKSVLVGIDRGARVIAPPKYVDPRPIVVYGTSITQGGCAARPGMVFTNIISRRFNRPFINLGFSGSGKGEPEVALVTAEIRNPAAIVLDYEGNVGWVEGMRNTLPAFIRILRRKHPLTPILVVSRCAFAGECHTPGATRGRLVVRDYQRDEVRRLRAAGDRHIFFHDGSDMLGTDFDECTVDGIHPTDLGFMRMADALTPVIRRLVK